MPTPLQIKLIHVAAAQIFGRDSKERYRMLLRNVGDVDSSTRLSPEAFEDCMAVLEDMGFSGLGSPTYWRDKVKLRGMYGNERMARKIHAMAAECRYELPALCLRFSHHRTEQVELLDPREQYSLIEMLKAVEKREAELAAARDDAHSSQTTSNGVDDDELPF